MLSRETGETSAEGQFADGDAHSEGTQITQTKDSLSIGHDNGLKGKASRSKRGEGHFVDKCHFYASGIEVIGLKYTYLTFSMVKNDMVSLTG